MPKLKPAWPFTIMLIGLLASTLASPSAAETPLAEPCHTLMTEQECGLFLTKQEHLKPGPERDHFLAAHHLIQQEREAAYKEQLATRYGIDFNRLLTLTNMPIKRFGSQLVSKNEFHDYMRLLKGAHRDDNLPGVMCRTLISVSWQGYVHDCDFHQMLDLPLGDGDAAVHLSSLIDHQFEHRPIRVADHCYGCTAGQGSSCGGALAANPAASLETL